MQRTIKLGVAFLFGILVLSAVMWPALTTRAANELKYGQAVTGQLGAKAKTEYTFQGHKGDRVMATMTDSQSGIDPFITLYDPQGNVIAQDDNGAEKSNARVQGIVLQQDGTYRIVAENVSPDQSGKFSLLVVKETAQGPIYFHGKASVNKLAYQLSRPWDHRDITYQVVNTQPGFNGADVKAIIRQAFQAWANVTPLTFREVNSGQSDIVIQFGNIDGPLNVLGETCPPSSPCSGQIQFDSSEPWVLGAPRSEEDISFLAVASHEFGHAIGLLHSNDASALMYYAYSPYNVEPGPDDVAGAQRLYGAGQGRVANAPTMAPPSTQNGTPQVQGTINNQRFANFWDFDVNQGEPVTITMKRASGNLDPFLVLIDANNNILAYDDDSGGGRDARLINIRLPQSGTYTVAATRAEQAQGYTTGDYILTIDYGTTTANNNPGAPTNVPPANTGSQQGGVQVSPGRPTAQYPSLDTTLSAPFTDSLTPVTQSQSAVVQANQSYDWSVTWCASDQNTLQKSLKNIRVTFAINGLACQDYSVLLSNWSPGSFTLTKTMTLTAPVYDGRNIYAAGDYVYRYDVQVQ